MENQVQAPSSRNFWRGVLAVLAVAVAAGLCYAFWVSRRFDKEGVEVMGVVTKVYTKTEYRTRRVTRRTSRREKVTVYYLDYRYWADGQAYEDSQRLGSYTNIRKGDSVAVCYLPDDPARSRLARDSTKNLKIKRRGLLRRH
ncbi:MAG: DUF3592 domain-containing protein [Alistipes sp.]|nr:DUF3592 domain-containing protein [Alistipes sp.]